MRRVYIVAPLAFLNGLILKPVSLPIWRWTDLQLEKKINGLGSAKL